MVRRRFPALFLLGAAALVAGSALADDPFGGTTPPIPTLRPHAYSLEECLALTDRNFPSLWAARARLANAHAILDEATWLPFFNWTATSNLYLLAPINGTPTYTSSSQSARNLTLTGGVLPWWSVDFSAVIPLYTFGKITAGRDAAEANIRVNEWDVEHWRQQARMDVRRSFFGAMYARDSRYVLEDMEQRLDKAIRDTRGKIGKAEGGGIDEVDLDRLEYYQATVQARAGDPDKGERYAMASLRFYTGVEAAFDIPDVPLKRPDRPIAPLLRYLSSARVFRPEVNMARAGIAARQAQVDLARANLFPDIGIGFGASYSIAPSATPQYQSVWAFDPFNHFGAGLGFGLRWSLDFLPKQAKIAEAESQLEEVRSTERFAVGGISVEVENAYGTAVEADNRERNWDEAEHRAKGWVASIETAIDVGTKSERDLMEPLRAFFDARVNHLTALMDLNVALSDLARVSGWDAAAPSGS